MRLRTIAVAAFMAAAAAGPASAQAWIGAVVANAMEHGAADCGRGIGVAPISPHLDAVQALMGRYASAVNGGDVAAAARLFADERDTRWLTQERQVTGREAIAALREAPAEAALPAPFAIAPTAIIFAGDMRTAKGVWRLSPPGSDAAAGDPVITMGVDFIRRGNEWRIWHLRTFVPPDAPVRPVYSCHFIAASAY